MSGNVGGQAFTRFYGCRHLTIRLWGSRRLIFFLNFRRGVACFADSILQLNPDTHMKSIEFRFKMKSWEEAPAFEPAEEPKLTRATVAYAYEGAVTSTQRVVNGSGTDEPEGISGEIRFESGHAEDYPITFNYAS
jgi:hypothetical protein